jgi:transmembrane sensor
MEKKIEDLLTDQSFRKYVLNPYQGNNTYWSDWQKANETNATIYEEARRLILGFYEPLSTEEYESEALKFRRSINITSSDKNSIINLYGQKRNHTHWLRYAAIFFAFCCVGALIISLTRGVNSSDIAEIPAPEFITKEAAKGQKLTIVFPDGTVVKLNSESSITYPARFAENIREVVLSGEAYFDVARYDNWPFTVLTGEVQTKVLGTAFNISYYPENDYINVALVSGSVQVSDKNNMEVTLKPKEMISIGEKGEALIISQFDFREVTGWKDNIIIFDKASFKDVQFTLERWYDVKFHYKNTPVFKGGYTGEFADQSLENVLLGMSANKFDFKIEGKNIFINQNK